MLIKVCGMRNADNIAQLIELRPEYMGFIFYKKSLRYAGEVVTPSLLSSIPKEIKKVAVFVNETQERILQIIHDFNFDVAQLHGNETPQLCASLKRNNIEVWKVFHPTSEKEFPNTKEYEKWCDYFLFDTPSPEYGGTGQKFNWTFLKQYKGETPFFISGGIGLDDIDKLFQIVHPEWVGVDVNSRFEIEPSIKNISLLQEFIRRMRLKRS